MKKIIKWATAITVCTHLANRMITRLALVKNLLSAKDGDYYDTRFGKVFYTKQGSGEPLLLIHDLQPESSGYEWSALAASLAKTHTVYTVDLPGCGRSEKQNITYTSYLYVQFLEHFCADVISAPAMIAATGTSCTFVILAAAETPTLASRLVLINPESFDRQMIASEKKASTYRTLLSLPVFGSSIYNHAVSLLRVREKFYTEYFYRASSALDAHIDTYYEAAHTGRTDGRFLYASILSGCMLLPIAHALPALTIPVTVVAGEEMPGALAAAEACKQLQPNVVIKTIPEAKRLPQLERPVQILHLLIEH